MRVNRGLILFLFAISVSASVNAAPTQREIFAQARQNLNLENVEFFQKGVFGLHGQDALFLASYDDVRTQTQVYSQMVQVLSGKFGCFIYGKVRRGDQQIFRCRDGRTIRMQHDRQGDIVFFRARQFDRRGHVLYVRSGHILASAPSH